MVFGAHIDYSSNGGPELVVIFYLGCYIEIVNVDDQQRLRRLVPEHARPLLGYAFKSYGHVFALAGFLLESICVGVTVESQN